MDTKHPVFVGCVALVGFFVIVVVVGAIWLFTGPEGGVRLPNEMEAYAQEYLDEHQILEGSEDLLAYYDVTLSLDGSEAVILTTTRVIYHKNGRNTSINIADIEDIRHRNEGLIGDVFEVSPTSGQSMKFEIAPLNQGETFKNVLMAEWERASSRIQ
jgi:hypothetical protein